MRGELRRIGLGETWIERGHLGNLKYWMELVVLTARGWMGRLGGNDSRL